MKRKLAEVVEKEKRILEYLDINGYDAAVIGRRDNFSWFSCGGHNCVVHTSEMGVCFAVITRNKRYLAANTMDGCRIMDEELQGMDFELINLRWYEKSPAQTVTDMFEGKKVLSDTALPGMDFKPGVFYKLQYPLTDGEVERYRWLGRKAEEIVKKAADEARPGMNELEIESLLMCEYAKYNIIAPVVIIGSDERIAKYRHCTPSDKKVNKMVMLAPAIQKWGLTVPVTRMVYFGDRLPEDLRKKFEAVCTIEAHTMAKCTPGNKFTDILVMQKKLYAETGYPDEWRNHFQGGITGYVINDPTKYNDPEAVIQDRQTFNWYITVTGVKVEETFLADKSRKEILTSNGLWPVKRFEAGGEAFDLPQIMLK